MSRFAVGEIAIVVYGPAKNHECEVLEINPINSSGQRQDYRIQIDGFPHPRFPMGWTCDEDTLRKKKPPKKEEHGSWEQLQKDTNWNPTKEKQHA